MEQGHGGEGRNGLRQDHRNKDAEWAGAVQHGGLIQLAGNAHEELPHQEHVRAPREVGGHDQGQPGSHPAQLQENKVGGDQRHRAGQDDGGEHEHEQNILLGDAEARKPVGHQGGRRHRSNGRKGRIHHGIAQQHGEVNGRPGFGDIFPLRSELPGALQLPPGALPHDRPGLYIGGVYESAFLPAFFDQRQLLHLAINLYFVDIVFLLLISELAFFRRPPGSACLAHLAVGLERGDDPIAHWHEEEEQHHPGEPGEAEGVEKVAQFAGHNPGVGGFLVCGHYLSSEA